MWSQFAHALSSNVLGTYPFSCSQFLFSGQDVFMNVYLQALIDINCIRFSSASQKKTVKISKHKLAKELRKMMFLRNFEKRSLNYHVFNIAKIMPEVIH